MGIVVAAVVIVVIMYAQGMKACKSEMKKGARK